MGQSDDSLDSSFMQQALTLAQHAAEQGEVPVGAVLVKDGVVIGEGWNQPISQCDPTVHAEIMAIRDASRRIDNYRLVDTTLYVTLEPCPMCVGAMLHARIARLVFGAHDPKTGAVESAIHLLNDSHHNHKITVTKGVMAKDCGDLLRDFFQTRR